MPGTEVSPEDMCEGTDKVLAFMELILCLRKIDNKQVCKHINQKIIGKCSEETSEKAMAPPLQYSCLENPMDRGAWWTAVCGVTKSRTRLRDFTLTFHFHALEKEMATHSSVLAWRIPGTGEPGGLPSMGCTESDTTEAT